MRHARYWRCSRGRCRARGRERAGSQGGRRNHARHDRRDATLSILGRAGHISRGTRADTSRALPRTGLLPPRSVTLETEPPSNPGRFIPVSCPSGQQPVFGRSGPHIKLRAPLRRAHAKCGAKIRRSERHSRGLSLDVGCRVRPRRTDVKGVKASYVAERLAERGERVERTQG